jgi:hypothetical protein
MTIDINEEKKVIIIIYVSSSFSVFISVFLSDLIVKIFVTVAKYSYVRGRTIHTSNIFEIRWYRSRRDCSRLSYGRHYLYIPVEEWHWDYSLEYDVQNTVPVPVEKTWFATVIDDSQLWISRGGRCSVRAAHLIRSRTFITQRLRHDSPWIVPVFVAVKTRVNRAPPNRAFAGNFTSR